MTDVHRVHWTNGSNSTPVSAVVRAVAELDECDPVELPPLIDSIDPDALNQLFLSDSNSSVARLAFHYCGYEIVVQQSEIELRTQNSS